MRAMRALVTLEIVPGATHLFEEPGTLDRVMQLATDWFAHYLGSTNLQDGVAPTEV
jgi:putative phosphoribosyl transferase